MEQVHLSSQEEIEFGDVGQCREKICDIGNESVNFSTTALCHICKRGYTGCDAS